MSCSSRSSGRSWPRARAARGPGPDPEPPRAPTRTSTQESSGRATGAGGEIVASWVSDTATVGPTDEEGLANAITVVLPTGQHRDDWLADHEVTDGQAADITAVDPRATSSSSSPQPASGARATSRSSRASSTRPALWTERLGGRCRPERRPARAAGRPSTSGRCPSVPSTVSRRPGRSGAGPARQARLSSSPARLLTA